MKLVLNQKSLNDLSLLGFLKFAKYYDGVELNFKKIKNTYQNNVKNIDIIDIISQNDTKLISIFNLKDFSLCNEKDFKTKVLRTLKEMLEICYKLEIELMIVRPSILSVPSPKWRILNKTRDRLKEISKMADKNDVKIGLEFLKTPKGSISTLSEAIDVIEPLSQDNLGLVLDNTVDIAQLKTSDLIMLARLRVLEENLQDNKHRFKKPKDFVQEMIRSKPELIDFSQNMMKLGYHDCFSLVIRKNKKKNN